MNDSVSAPSAGNHTDAGMIARVPPGGVQNSFKIASP